MKPYFAELETPLGNLRLLASKDHLTHVYCPEHRGASIPEVRCGKEHPVLHQAAEQLRAYFGGELRDFDFANQSEGNVFSTRCLDSIRDDTFWRNLDLWKAGITYRTPQSRTCCWSCEWSKSDLDNRSLSSGHWSEW